MPSPGELANMRQDLDFKEGEMHKSKTTASGLAGGNNRCGLKVILLIHSLMNVVIFCSKYDYSISKFDFNDRDSFYFAFFHRE